MGLSKQLQIGPAQVSISEGEGVASLSISVSESVGGGQAEGILKVKASAEVDLGAKQAADLGIALLEIHFQALKPLLEGLKSAIDDALLKP